LEPKVKENHLQNGLSNKEHQITLRQDPALTKINSQSRSIQALVGRLVHQQEMMRKN
jgi:hypothetical protein